MDFLEKEIKKIINVAGEIKEEIKTIGEIINAEKDVLQLENGNYVIRKSGIQKMADYVGAYWKKPEVIDTPTINNNKGFYVIVECVFPDGTSNFAPGESSEKNNKFVSDYMFITAVNRAKAASFLRSSYMELHDVYSDDEADAFQEKMKENSGSVNKKEMEKLAVKQKQYVSMIQEMSKLIALPDEDEEYPKAYVYEVWDIHKDLDYLKKLTEHENKVIQFIAKNKLKEAEKEVSEEEISKEGN